MSELLSDLDALATIPYTISTQSGTLTSDKTKYRSYLFLSLYGIAIVDNIQIPNGIVTNGRQIWMGVKDKLEATENFVMKIVLNVTGNSISYSASSTYDAPTMVIQIYGIK